MALAAPMSREIDPLFMIPSRSIGLSILLAFVASAGAFAQAADTTRFTNVGNLRLAISNFGTIGTGWAGWPSSPSAEYPRSSGIEHIFIGGVWLGGVKEFNGNSVAAVSTGAVDISAVRDGAAGFELTTELRDRMRERSSDIESPFYSPSAISQQDFLADFVDTNKIIPNASRAQVIPDHEYPLGLSVHLESYAWSYPFADNFVILRYRVRNVSATSVDSLHIGLWSDAVVRNTQLTPPGGSAFYASGAENFSDSLRAIYEYDGSATPGAVDHYVALKFLGSTPVTDSVFFNSWQFRNSTGAAWTLSPATDADKFRRMSTTFLGFDTAAVRAQLAIPSNRSIMISAGNFGRLAPGDSVEAVFAVIVARKPGPTATDAAPQRRFLETSCGWAQRAYDGTDQNGNGRLDTSEVDLRGTGEIVRYILPAPPRAPRTKVVPGDRRLTIYWNDASEGSLDLLTNRKNFEGYRVYRSNPGEDLDAVIDSLALVTERDLVNTVGLNIGLEGVRIRDDAGAPTTVRFPGDTTGYTYMVELDGLLNGWQYAVAVTAYSGEDAGAGIPELESSRIATQRRVFPGTPPDSTGAREVGVYPNPYYVRALWDGRGERQRKLYFYNLPPRARITIFSPAGDAVATLDHDAAVYNGADLGWYRSFTDGTQELAGGEHAWDLVTSGDQALASGVYVFTVEDLEAGTVAKGRFVVIK